MCILSCVLEGGYVSICVCLGCVWGHIYANNISRRIHYIKIRVVVSILIAGVKLPGWQSKLIKGHNVNT